MRRFTKRTVGPALTLALVLVLMTAAVAFAHDGHPSGGYGDGYGGHHAYDGQGSARAQRYNDEKAYFSRQEEGDSHYGGGQHEGKDSYGKGYDDNGYCKDDYGQGYWYGSDHFSDYYAGLYGKDSSMQGHDDNGSYGKHGSGDYHGDYHGGEGYYSGSGHDD